MLLDYMKFVFGFALATLASYIYSFLRYDSFDVSIITILSWFDNKWAAEPDDWIGLHKLLDMIPVYGAVPIVFVLAIIAWLFEIYDESEIVDKEMEKIKKTEDAEK